MLPGYSAGVKRSVLHGKTHANHAPALPQAGRWLVISSQSETFISAFLGNTLLNDFKNDL